LIRLKNDDLVKSPPAVIPAKAGIQNLPKELDSVSSTEGQNRAKATFYGVVKNDFTAKEVR
jgi:hypothetical protein